jgi:hypothetical protein
MKEMESVKNLLNGKDYKISRIVKSMVVLNSLDGESQILTELDNLNIFYRKIDSYRDEG